VLIAPSRCGKTPTSMYLALMHGIFVANYPLVDEDLGGEVLPRSIAGLADRCFGLLTSPERLSAVRGERRAGSRYASLEQTRWELSAPAASTTCTRCPSSTPRASPSRRCPPSSCNP